MIHTLKEVKTYLSTYLQRVGAKERRLNVGQVLDPLTFIKEDHSTLVGKVETITLSTLSGPCCGPMRNYGTPEHTALALWEKLEPLIALVPSAYVHISNPYIDYTKGTIYHENANWTTLIDVAIYSYDGMMFKTIRNANGSASGLSSELTPTVDCATHVLCTVQPFQIKVFEPNVLSQLQYTVDHVIGKNKQQFFEDLRNDFDRAVEYAWTQLSNIESRATPAKQEVSPEESTSAYAKADDLLRAGKYQEFAEVVANHFDSPVTVHLNAGFIEGFELNGKHYLSTELVAMMKIAGQPQSKLEPQGDPT
jgi:hypothetical protein